LTVSNWLVDMSVTYYPIKPPVMMSDKVEKTTYDEPNPTAAWLKKKAEMDAKLAAAAQNQDGGE